MAVQAQYPSNVLLLNRNGEQMNDYTLQTETGGSLDQSQMLFFNNNNGGIRVNPPNRGRETSALGSINLFSLQPQPPVPQLINLSQLHNQPQQQQQQPPNLVSTGLRLAFNENHHHNQQQSFMLSEDLSTEIKQQRDEIDQFLQLQGEQLRRTLAERRQSHYRALLSVAEESAARRLQEKETEVQKATNQNAELVHRVARLRVEAQIWQNKARAQEATAAALQVQIQQAMMGMGAHDRREEGGGCSGGGGGGGEAEDAESAHVDPERVVSCDGPSCKACRGRAASVVLLPCRHLCLCSNCNATVDTCPVCLTFRSASVEVYL